MASAGLTNSIDDQAAEWVVEVAHGELTPESQAELEAWLAADRRHRGAFIRAQAWLRASEEAVIEASRPAASLFSATPALASEYGNGRRHGKGMPGYFRRGRARWIGKLAAGAIALAGSVSVLVALNIPAPAPVKQAGPATGERVMKLRDGSVATLSAGGKIEVALSPTLRSITLLSGRATFHVAKDKARPFVVRSGAVYAEATGTIYSVRRVGQTGGAVSVTRGSVLVWPRDDRDQAVLLHAGGTMMLDPSPEPTASPTPRLPPPDVAQISLDDVPIRSAVERFNRINSTKIVIADPSIGNIKIIGLYRADDPEKFARAAAAIAGGEAVQDHGRIVIELK